MNKGEGGIIKEEEGKSADRHVKKCENIVPRFCSLVRKHNLETYCERLRKAASEKNARQCSKIMNEALDQIKEDDNILKNMGLGDYPDRRWPRKVERYEGVPNIK